MLHFRGALYTTRYVETEKSYYNIGTREREREVCTVTHLMSLVFPGGDGDIFVLFAALPKWIHARTLRLGDVCEISHVAETITVYTSSRQNGEIIRDQT